MAAATTGAATEAVVETAVTASKAIVVMDHIKNNRLEYLILLAISTILGWTNEAATYVQGMCV